MPIHHLHEPVDVFSEWLDECEAAHNRSRSVQQPGANNSAIYDDDDDDDLPESTGMGNRKPAARKVNSKNESRAASIDLGLADSDDDEDEDD
jgi:hypothetical protein